MHTLTFYKAAANALDRPTAAFTGTAWFVEPNLVVTCFHCVSFQRSGQWASDDTPGHYALTNESGKLVTLLPVLALRSLDVALLRLEASKTTARPRPAGTHALVLSDEWLAEGTAWHADVRPKILHGIDVRLGGLVTRASSIPRQPHQLTVDQGTDVDWEASSGSPVLCNGLVIGILGQQFHRANTCYAVPAHAIALALWVDRCHRALAMIRPAWQDHAQALFGHETRCQRTDRQADDLVGLHADVDRWLAAAVPGEIVGTDRQHLIDAFHSRPQAPPTSAQEDLSRRCSRALASADRPTSDSLLAPSFMSGVAAANVFVAPQLTHLQRSATAAGPSGNQPAVHEEAEMAGTSLTYLDFLDRVSPRPGGSPNRVAILGEAGAGKTTLLRDLAAEVLNRDWGLPVQLHYQQLGNGPVHSALELAWLPWLGITGAAREPYLPELTRLSRTGRLWVLIDGIDEVGAARREPLERIARDIGGVLNSANVIVASRHAYWYHGVNELHGFQVYDLAQFTPEKVFATVMQWFAVQPSVGEQLVERLRNPAGRFSLESVRNPLRLAMLCAIWQDGAHQGAGRPVELPASRSTLYETFLHLSHAWNAKREAVGAVDRESLFDALGRLALHLLSIAADEPASAIHAGGFDENAIRVANPQADAALLKAVRECGWLASPGEVTPSRSRLRFAHRTWLEYFAARSIASADQLLDITAVPPCTRALEAGWREVCLFWVGLPKMPAADKNRFMARLSTLKDGCNGLYGDRALHLVAACMREYNGFDAGQAYSVIRRIMAQAVGLADIRHGGWMIAFPTLSTAAASALAEAPSDLVGEAAGDAFAEFPEDGPAQPFLDALMDVLVNASGDDETCGKIAAAILLSGESDHGLYKTGPLLRNPGFVAELSSTMRRCDADSPAFTILASAQEQAAVAADLVYDCLRQGKHSRPRRRALLGVIQTLERASPEAVAYLERAAFGARTLDRATWLTTLAAVTPDALALSDRILDHATRHRMSRAEQLKLVKVLARLPAVSEPVARYVLARLGRWLSPDNWYDPLQLMSKACAAHPHLTSPYFRALSAKAEPDLVWHALVRWSSTTPPDDAAPELLQWMTWPQDRVRCWAAKVLLGNPGAYRQACIDVLCALVKNCSVEASRRQETPWVAAQTLGELKVASPVLINHLIALADSSHDVDTRLAAIDCLGHVAVGSGAAAECIVRVLRDSDNEIVRYLRPEVALKSIGLNRPEDRKAFVALVETDERVHGVRWWIEALTALDIDDPRAVDTVGRVASAARDEFVVGAALTYLLSRRSEEASVRRAALKVLKSDKARVRQEAIRALGQCRTANADVTQALLKSLRSEFDFGVLRSTERSFRLQVTGREESRSVVAALRRIWEGPALADDDNEYHRRHAAYSLLLDIAARTPYDAFMQTWIASGTSP